MYKITILILIIFIFGNALFSAQNRAGIITAIIGGKSITKIDLSGAKSEIGMNSVLNIGDTLSTDLKTYAKIVLDCYDDKPVFMMRPGTTLTLVESKKRKKKSWIAKLFGGLLYSGSGKDHQGFKVETANAIAGVEGTEFEINYDKNQQKTEITVFSGKIKFRAKLKKGGIITGIPICKLKAGDRAFVTKNRLKKLKSIDEEKINLMLNKWNQVFKENNLDIDENNYDADDNLETYGEKSVTIFLEKKKSGMTTPLPTSAKLFINGYSKVNGKELFFYYKNRYCKINNLESGIYDLDILCNGYKFKTNFEIKDEDLELRIPYRRFKLIIEFKNGNELLQNPWPSKFFSKELNAEVNSIPVKLLHKSNGALDNTNSLRYDSLNDVFIYLPLDESVYPVNIGFSYKGKRVLKNVIDYKGKVSKSNKLLFIIESPTASYSNRGSFIFKK